MAFKGLKTAVEKAGSGMKMVKIKPGGNATIRYFFPLDDVVSVFEHVLKNGDRYYSFTCIGKDNGCPECAKGKYASMKAYIPVIDDADDKVKIWKASKAVAESIVQIDEEYAKEGGLIGMQTKWTRTGPTNQPTYSPIKTSKAVAISKSDLADFMAQIPDVERATAEKPLATILEEIEAFFSGSNNDSGGGDEKDDNDRGNNDRGNNGGGKGNGDDDYPF